MLGGGLAGDVVREFGLPVRRDGPAVDLVAAAVVEVLGGKEAPALVAAGGVGGPLEDVGELLVGLWLGGAEDVDGAAGGGFALLVLREGDVAVLEVLHGDAGTGRGGEARVVGGLISVALGGVAEEVGGVDVGAAGGRLREKPHHTEAIEARVRAGHVAARVAVGAGEVAVGADEGELLVPGVGGGRVGKENEGCKESGQGRDGSRGVHLEGV